MCIFLFCTNWIYFWVLDDKIFAQTVWKVCNAGKLVEMNLIGISYFIHFIKINVTEKNTNKNPAMLMNWSAFRFRIKYLPWLQKPNECVYKFEFYRAGFWPRDNKIASRTIFWYSLKLSAGIDLLLRLHKNTNHIQSDSPTVN